MRLLTHLRACLPLLAGCRPAVGLVRSVLLVYLLALGAAIASPMVQPRAMEFICSAGGLVKAVVQTDDGVADMGAGHLDCAACVISGAPPTAPWGALPHVPPRGHAPQAIPATRTSVGTAAPMPARGPPAHS